MARIQIAADFEEGTAGATIDPEAADPHDLGLTIAAGTSATYTTEAHSGSLAARIEDGSIQLSTVAAAESTRGGGGWFKIKARATEPASTT